MTDPENKERLNNFYNYLVVTPKIKDSYVRRLYKLFVENDDYNLSFTEIMSIILHKYK